jgi:hypothetical protein
MHTLIDSTKPRLPLRPTRSILTTFEIPVESLDAAEAAANKPLEIKIQELVQEQKKKKAEILGEACRALLCLLQPVC